MISRRPFLVPYLSTPHRNCSPMSQQTGREPPFDQDDDLGCARPICMNGDAARNGSLASAYCLVSRIDDGSNCETLKS